MFMKNLKNKCRRGLAVILSLVMCLGMLTVPAFAAEEEVPEVPETPEVQEEQGVVCTKNDTCAAETHEDGCPVKTAEEAEAAAKAEAEAKAKAEEEAAKKAAEEAEAEAKAKAEEEEAAKKAAEEAEAAAKAEEEAKAKATLADMIAALPAPEEIDPENEELVEEISNQISEIYAFAEENGFDVEDDETINAVIAALYPAETLEEAEAGTPDNPWDISAGDGESRVVAYVEQNNSDDENPTYTLTITGTGKMIDGGLSWALYPNAAAWLAAGYRNAITHVIVTDGVTHIGDGGLGYLDYMETLELGKDLATFGKSPFFQENASVLKTIKLSPENTALKLEGEALLSADGKILYTCTNNPEYFQVPDSVEIIWSTAFGGDRNLKSIDLNQVKEIQTYAFLGTSLTELSVPSTATSIAPGAFRTGTLKNAIFDAPTLPVQTFLECTSLESLTIGPNVTKLNTPVPGCPNLKTVYFNAKACNGDGSLLNRCDAQDVTVYIGGEVTSIPAMFAENCQGLKHLIFEPGPGLCTIAGRAFNGCKNLTTLEGSYSERISKIEGVGFKNTGLTGKLVFGEQLSSIGPNAFRGSQLEEVHLMSNSTDPFTMVINANDDNSLLNGITSLKVVRIDNIAEIRVGLVARCTSLHTLDLSALPDDTQINYQWAGGKGNIGQMFGNVPRSCIAYVNSEQSTVKAACGDKYLTFAVTNGGTFPETAAFKANILATPMREGYTFAGWYGNAECEGTPVTTTEAGKAYYAKWEENAETSLNPEKNSVAFEMTYGETPVAQTVNFTGEGSIQSVSSTNASFSVTFENNTVTITPVEKLLAGLYEGKVYVTTVKREVLPLVVTLTVKPAGSTGEVEADKPVDETEKVPACSYGEVINLTAKVKRAEQQAPVTPKLRMARSRAVQADQDMVSFYYGETLLGKALVYYDDANARDSGTATLPYETSRGILPCNQVCKIRTVYGGSLNQSGSEIDPISVLVQKLKTQVSITASESSLTNGGTVTLTVSATGLPEGAEINVTSSPSADITSNGNGTFTVVLPSSMQPQVYTITAEYAGNDFYESSKGTCSVTVDHGHSYRDTITPPTCTEPGYTTHTCDCGDSYQDTEVEALGHDFAEAWNHDAANHWHVCTRCNKPSDAAGHTETSEITLRPTYTREGERTYTCTVCGATRTESIDRLPYEPSYPSGGGNSSSGGSTGGTTTNPSTPTTTIPDDPTPLDPGVTIGDQDVPLTGITFEDVTPGDWFYEAVQYVYGKDLMKGTSETQFSPYASTQRGMIVTILHRLEGTPAAEASAFADVEAGQWYANAVGWGSANGVVEGYSATEFRPLQNITREQLAAILYRYAQLKGYDTSKRADLSGYSDASAISAYALEAMRWAVAEGLIAGKTETTLAPGGEATRAEAAMILMRFCETIAAAPAANETQGLPDGI